MRFPLDSNNMSDSALLGPLTPSAMPSTGGVNMGAGNGLLRVVSPDMLNTIDAANVADRERKRQENRMEPALEGLASHVRKQFDIMRRHRDGGTGWSNRLIESMRMFNGQYDSTKLSEIRSFGGSEIYARVIAMKCRGATSLLRDIYLNAERPWGIDPTPVPEIPDDISANIDNAVGAELALAQQGAQSGLINPTTGMPVQVPSDEEVASRRTTLETALMVASRKKAREEALEAERYLDDLLVEGGFYKALAEFLTDLPLFPFAVIRGPIVYMTQSISWEKNADGSAKLVKKAEPRMFWKRVSPFDLWWTPGASTVDAANIIYRERRSRSEINSMLGVPGYRDSKIKEILTEYAEGYTEAPDGVDSTRASQESRENPHMNESGMYDCLEFHGTVPAKVLREFGMSATDVPDLDRDYTVQLWMVGRFVFKVQLAPSPRERPPFYITSFNKVPGTMVGNALPDTLSDIQDVCNAALRALVNNMAMSSGPQVAINEDMLGAGEDTTAIFPWRIWKWSARPGSVATDPVKFFQPVSNAQQLLGVYEKFTQIADEISAIPRYITGSDRMGGAGRTASGLAMLMGNASKMLQTVAANVDSDVFEPLLQFLYDIVMLTDKTGKLRGDESVRVRGVTVAMQRETQRQRQIEMLQATANPMDAQIVGLRGRGALLRSIASSLGLDGEIIVPSDDELVQREKMLAAQAMAQQQQPPGAPPGNPTGQGTQRGGEETGPSAIQGPRENLNQQLPQ